MTPDILSLGRFTVHGVRDGFFYLDGGSMFGVVPKVLWEKIYPADQENRIKLGLNSLLVDTGKERVLIETGIGAHLNRKWMDTYAVERGPGLLGALEQRGYAAEDISIVINTHLHFDHCGGNTTKDDRGEFIPTYPRARYIIQRCEWENGCNPNRRDKPSYMPEFYLPLEKHGVLQWVEGDTVITEGVEVIMASGHTSCHQCVLIRSGDLTLVFLGDMVPTSAHVGLAYIMSYDLFPTETLRNKELFFERALQENWIVAFNHDPDHFFGRIAMQNGKYRFQELERER